MLIELVTNLDPTCLIRVFGVARGCAASGAGTRAQSAGATVGGITLALQKIVLVTEFVRAS